MKFFSAETIRESLRFSRIEDSFLALLCVCKVLDAAHQANLNNWMTFEKSDLVRELVRYFDFETGKVKEGDGNGSISIIFARNFAASFEKVNPVYLGAICFRKYGIPDDINSVEGLVNYIKTEFCLTDDFCNDVFLRIGVNLPEFVNEFSNIEFEQSLKDQNNIGNEEGFFAISCGPKNVIKNSAGALGASYFQTLYSKMPSKVCLITEYPDEYLCFKNQTVENKSSVDSIDAIEDRKISFIVWLSKNCRGTPEFQKHMVCVLEKWLDAKIPNANIGNLFRFEKSADYEIEKNRISAMPTWDAVNEKDSNGRPRTALNHYLNFLKEFEREEPNTSSPRQQNPSFTPAQIIYYGVPGCGKSNKIKQDFENGNVDEEAQVVRCVFHPEYTNADFVGQIFPVVKKDGKGVDYKFKPGPFTEILRRAYLNPHTKFFLVIEEINRGNAAAIFGEMFQLLDRIKEGKDKSGFGPGWSSYSILNDDVNDYIRNIEAFDKFEHVGCVKPNLYKDMRDGNGNVVDAPDENGKKEIDFSTATSYSSLELTLQGFDVPQIFRESTSIRLPPNLSIYATMNTSDQNVFTLDNAFQRRFDMEMIPNELDTSDADSKVQYETVIGGAAEKSTGVSWGVFRDWINGKISNANTLLSTEDRCLGGWFVTSDSITDKKKFAEKVLKYLWDDAFKHNREIFKLKSLSEIVAKFVETNGSDAFKEIFGEVPEVKDAV